MTLNSIESLIYEAPSRDDGGHSDFIYKLDLFEQQRVRNTLAEIHQNTTIPDILIKPDQHLSDVEANAVMQTEGTTLRTLAQNNGWQDMLSLVRDTADACVGMNGNEILQIAGAQDTNRIVQILQRLNFVSKGLRLLNHNHILDIRKKVLLRTETQPYPIPRENTILYNIIPDKRLRTYADVQEINLTTRALPELDGEARVSINVKGQTAGGVPIGGIISIDHGVKARSYRPDKAKVRPQIDFRLGRYGNGDILDGIDFKLNGRQQNFGHHFKQADGNPNTFADTHQVLNHCFSELHRYDNDRDRTGKRLFYK